MARVPQPGLLPGAGQGSRSPEQGKAVVPGQDSGSSTPTAGAGGARPGQLHTDESLVADVTRSSNSATAAVTLTAPRGPLPPPVRWAAPLVPCLLPDGAALGEILSEPKQAQLTEH